MPFLKLLDCTIPSNKLSSGRETGVLESMGLECFYVRQASTSHSKDIVVFRREVASCC